LNFSHKSLLFVEKNSRDVAISSFEAALSSVFLQIKGVLWEKIFFFSPTKTHILWKKLTALLTERRVPDYDTAGNFL
jgi:hypothetical protein